MEHISFFSELKEKGQVKVKGKRNCQIVQLLKKEGLVHSEQQEEETIVTVDKQLMHFESLHVGIIAKKRQVKELAAKFLPSVTGHLIMVTSEGVMTHHEAIQKNIGGVIIALVC